MISYITYILLVLATTPNLYLKQDTSSNSVTFITNGIEWQSINESVNTKIGLTTYAIYDEETQELRIMAENSERKISRIIFQIQNVKGPEVRTLKSFEDKIIVKINQNWFDSTRGDFAQIDIQKLDLDERQISGKFEFSAGSLEGKQIEIKKGQFNLSF